jgi:CHAT domain-containing protein
MDNQITVLFLAANPVNMGSRLRLDKEYRDISDKVRAGRRRDSIKLVCEWSVKASDLAQALLAHNPQIVHFSGHGGRSNGITLEDDFGNAKPVNKQAFARLFKALKDDIRLVVLNACYSEDQANWLKEIVDYTIGMSAEVKDNAAIAFSAALYEALSYGRTVRSAFELALTSLDLKDIPGSDVPRLLAREGVDESLPFFAPLNTKSDAIENQRVYPKNRIKSASEGSRMKQVIDIRGENHITLTSGGDLSVGELSAAKQDMVDSDRRPTEAPNGGYRRAKRSKIQNSKSETAEE